MTATYHKRYSGDQRSKYGTSTVRNFKNLEKCKSKPLSLLYIYLYIYIYIFEIYFFPPFNIKTFCLDIVSIRFWIPNTVNTMTMRVLNSFLKYKVIMRPKNQSCSKYYT